MKTYKIKLVVDVYDPNITEQEITKRISCLFVDDNIFTSKLSVTEIE